LEVKVLYNILGKKKLQRITGMPRKVIQNVSKNKKIKISMVSQRILAFFLEIGPIGDSMFVKESVQLIVEG